MRRDALEVRRVFGATAAPTVGCIRQSRGNVQWVPPSVAALGTC